MNSTMKEWLKVCKNVTKDLFKRTYFHPQTSSFEDPSSDDDNDGRRIDPNAMFESLDVDLLALARDNSKARSPVTYSGHVKEKINVFEKMNAQTEDSTKRQIREIKSIKPGLQDRVRYFDEFYNKNSKKTNKISQTVCDENIIYHDEDKNTARTRKQQLDDFILSLIEEMHVQSFYMKEATNFIKACLKVKGFRLGDVHLEAERLLLLAGLKRDMLLKMVRELQFEQELKMRPKSQTIRAEISCLSFSTLHHHKNKMVSFMIACTNKNDMHVSHIIKSKSQEGSISVSRCQKFEDLYVDDAKLKITVYQLICHKSGILQFKNETNKHRRINSIQYKDSSLGLLIEDQVLEPLYKILESLEINFEDIENITINRQDYSSLHGLLTLTQLEGKSHSYQF